MPTTRIRFRCECGKEYALAPEHAGRKGKCACGQVLTVPGAQPESGNASPVLPLPGKKVASRRSSWFIRFAVVGVLAVSGLSVTLYLSRDASSDPRLPLGSMDNFLPLLKKCPPEMRSSTELYSGRHMENFMILSLAVSASFVLSERGEVISINIDAAIIRPPVAAEVNIVPLEFVLLVASRCNDWDPGDLKKLASSFPECLNEMTAQESQTAERTIMSNGIQVRISSVGVQALGNDSVDLGYSVTFERVAAPLKRFPLPPLEPRR